MIVLSPQRDHIRGIGLLKVLMSDFAEMEMSEGQPPGYTNQQQKDVGALV